MNEKKSLKLKGFYVAMTMGFIAFFVLALKMKAPDLVTLCQFYFGYNGIVAGGFFGFRFGEQWALTKNGKQ